MCEQSAEAVIELVDLGAACKETRQLAPIYIVCDSIWAYMNYRPEGCNVGSRDNLFTIPMQGPAPRWEANRVSDASLTSP